MTDDFFGVQKLVEFVTARKRVIPTYYEDGSKGFAIQYENGQMHGQRWVDLGDHVGKQYKVWRDERMANLVLRSLLIHDGIAFDEDLDEWDRKLAIKLNNGEDFLERLERS